MTAGCAASCGQPRGPHPAALVPQLRDRPAVVTSKERESMPVRTDAQTATNKWVNNLSNSTAAMTAGANRVTQSPGVLAAAAADKWLARVTAAKAKFIARVGAVTVDQWRTAYTTYGIQRVASGAQAKQGKMLSFQTDWLNYLQANMSKIDRMPTVTLQDGINKAVAQIQLNAQFKRGSA